MPDTRIDGALALPDLPAIRAAHARIASHVQRTPVLTCRALDAAVGASLFFKCENFQRIGAFKARGAVNAVFSLSDADAARGVVTHSGVEAKSVIPTSGTETTWSHAFWPRTIATYQPVSSM